MTGLIKAVADVALELRGQVEVVERIDRRLERRRKIVVTVRREDVQTGVEDHRVRQILRGICRQVAVVFPIPLPVDRDAEGDILRLVL